MCYTSTSWYWSTLLTYASTHIGLPMVWYALKHEISGYVRNTDGYGRYDNADIEMYGRYIITYPVCIYISLLH